MFQVHFFLHISPYLNTSPPRQFMVVLFLWMNASMSAVSTNIFRPPGKRTTGMSPAQILSRRAQTVNPRYRAASFKGSNRGHDDTLIPYPFFFSMMPDRFISLCPNYALMDIYIRDAQKGAENREANDLRFRFPQTFYFPPPSPPHPPQPRTSEDQPSDCRIS